MLKLPFFEGKARVIPISVNARLERVEVVPKTQVIQIFFTVILLFCHSGQAAWPTANQRSESSSNGGSQRQSVNENQSVENPLKASAIFSPATISIGANGELNISISLEEGYHAYLDKFRLKAEDPRVIQIDNLQIDPVVTFQDSFSKTVKKGVVNTATIKTRFEVPQNLSLEEIEDKPHSTTSKEKASPGKNILGFALRTFREKKIINYDDVELKSGFHSEPTKKDLEINLLLTYQACTKSHCLFPKTIKIPASLQIVQGPTIGPAPSIAALHEPKLKNVNTGTVNQGAQQNKTSVAPSQASGNSNDYSINDSSSFKKALSKGYLFALLFVFLVGMATSLTPCIYPMIPVTLAVLGAKSHGQKKSKSFALSIVYVLGIAVTYATLGLIAAQTGALFGSLLSHPVVVSVLAILFILMGLSMYGAFELQAPRFIRNYLGHKKTDKTYLGAFFAGTISGVVASPCVGPVLVSILTHVAQTQNMLFGFTTLFVFALGMGVLFIVLGTSSALLRHLPKSGPWMNFVKFIFGSIMISMALYYIKPVYPTWLFRILLGFALAAIGSGFGAFTPLKRRSSMRQIQKGSLLTLVAIGIAFISFGTLEVSGITFNSGQIFTSQRDSYPKLNWTPFDETMLNEARDSGKPVIIDFFADWCAACLELEHETFTDPRVQHLSNRFLLLKVDATQESKDLDRLIERFQVVGLPTLIFYDERGHIRDDLTLTGFESADQFLDRMNSLLDQAKPSN